MFLEQLIHSKLRIDSMQVRADTRKVLETKEEQIEALEARNEALERTNADVMQRPEGFRCVIGVFHGGLITLSTPQNGLSLATMGRSLADEADGSIDSLIRGFKISKQPCARLFVSSSGDVFFPSRFDMI